MRLYERSSLRSRVLTPEDWQELAKGLIRYDKDKSDLVIDEDRITELTRDLTWSPRKEAILKAIIARVILEASLYGYLEL